MIKIRKGFFETNSSSTHCLTIGDLDSKVAIIDKKINKSYFYSWLNKGDYITKPSDKLQILLDYIFLVYPELIEKFVKKVERITKQDRSEIFEDWYFDGREKDKYEYHNPSWMKLDDLNRIYKNLKTFIFGNGFIETYDNNIGYYACSPDDSDNPFYESDIDRYENSDFKWNNG